MRTRKTSNYYLLREDVAAHHEGRYYVTGGLYRNIHNKIKELTVHADHMYLVPSKVEGVTMLKIFKGMDITMNRYGGYLFALRVI